MTSAIDTNVIVALWDKDDAVNSAAESALDAALRPGHLVIPAPAFAELLACRGRSEAFLFPQRHRDQRGLEPGRGDLADGRAGVPKLRCPPAEAT